MINLDDQIELFKLLGRELRDKVECIAIGGSAMMFYGAKESTKDIDLVFLNKNDMTKLKKTLFNIGFEEKKNIIKIFEHYEIAENKPVMMEGKDRRFDLFVNEVISMKISNEMLGRIKEVHEFGNLLIKILSPEDIIMLKCATEREKDRLDALELIKKFNINWEIIIEESLNQTKIGGDVYPVLLFDFLSELKEDLKADIPSEVIKKIRKIAEKIMLRKIKEKKHIKIRKYKKKK